MKALMRLIRTLATPMAGDPYTRGAIGGLHILLGAAMVDALGWYGLGPALALAWLYWLAKERADLRRGGALWDGIEDSLFVCMGTLYGMPHWPLYCLGAVVLVMWIAEARR